MNNTQSTATSFIVQKKRTASIGAYRKVVWLTTKTFSP